MQPDSIRRLKEALQRGADVAVLGFHAADPTGYGRLVVEDGALTAIVEEKDASPAQKAINFCNGGLMALRGEHGLSILDTIGNDNAPGEFYLTEAVVIARERGLRAVAETIDEEEVHGVNDRAQLAVLRAELNRRILRRWMLEGVTVVDPATTWVDVDVTLARDVTLLPGTQLHGATAVAERATIGPDTTLTDVEVGAGATVVRTHGSLAIIGAGATVGPFSYLRPGAELGAGGKIGTFVEIKNARIGAGSKVPHLSYVGDATIGEQTNIGAASVFVNYDGVRKQHTTIGSFARTGADNMFVAPVTVGDGAYTGAGSVIRRNVPPGALGVSQGSQRNIEGWVLRARAGTPAALAAERAIAAANPVDGLSPQARAERERAGQAASSLTPTPPPSLPDQHPELPDSLPTDGSPSISGAAPITKDTSR